MMHNVNVLVYAYRQAPWRIQRQWIGVFLLIVLGLAMVAALYLDVTARAALAGREIQNLSASLTAIQQSNADLETRIAALTSTTVMQQRATQLGYRPLDSSELQFILVPDYTAPGASAFALAPAPRPAAAGLEPAYTQSLLEWFDEHLHLPGSLSMTGSVQ
jgi:hypothetical protein